MTDGNSFDPQGRTILRPRPGAKRPEVGGTNDVENHYTSAALSDNLQQARLGEVFQVSAPRGGNRILYHATELLALASKLSLSPSHQDIEQLKQHLTRAVKNFSTALLQQGYLPDIVQDASYALCTLLDETILNTPWGAHSSWGRQTLLASFHGEAWGGENFFVKLERFKSQPANYLDILEFYYLCLSFGLQGRYRVMERGAALLEAVREDLYQLIRRQKGGFERSLSRHWQGVRNLSNPLIQYTPWWLVVSVSCALLLVIFLLFAYWMNGYAEPLLKRVDQIAREQNPYRNEYVALVEYVPEPVEPPEQVRIEQRKRSLKELLAPEIEQGLVEVFERDGSVIIRTRGLFMSGSDQVMSQMRQLIERIGDELEGMQGRILIAGHTDNVPIFNLRFTSNWALSKARAETVRSMLEDIITSDVGFATEGRADNEPVLPNDTPGHRARNRRVEIVVTER